MGTILSDEDLGVGSPKKLLSDEDLNTMPLRGSESPAEAPSTLQAPAPADTLEMGTPVPAQRLLSDEDLNIIPTYPVSDSPEPQMSEAEDNSLKDEEIWSNPDMMAPVRQYMVQKRGQQWADPEKRSDEEVWDTFKTHQRAILSGEVSLIGEIVSVRNWDEKQREVAAQALDVYDKAAPFWEQGLKEGAEAVWDYTRNVINPFESPSTILSVGTGAIASKTLGKAAGMAALRTAYRSGGKEGMKKVAAELAKKKALTVGATSAAFDGSLAASSDVAYQKGVEIPLDRKDEVDWGEVALTGAIGALPAGVLGTAAYLRKGKGAGVTTREAKEAVKQYKANSSKRVGPKLVNKFKNTRKKLETVKGRLSDDEWKAMSDKGRLNPQTNEFNRFLFDTFLNPHNEDSVARVMIDNDAKLEWTKGKGEFTKSVMKYIKDMDPEYRAPMAESWEEATGTTLDEGLDLLADFVRTGGETFKGISDFSKVLDNKKAFDTTVKDALLSGKTPEVEDVPKGVMGYIMNVWKQLLVSHPATTAVNIQGWSLASVTRAATDFLEDGFNLKNQATNFTSRAKVLSDPLGTKESFKFAKESFAPKNVLSDLNVNFGGVYEKTGSERFNIPQNSLVKGVDKGVNWAGRMSLVQAQDDWTRAISGFIELERQLQRKYGKSYSEMINSGKIKELSDPEIWEKVAKTSLEDTFSFDFGRGKDQIAKAAKLMGDLSQNSASGWVFPFGKFMANSLAFSMRHSPLGIMRIAGGMTGMNKKVPLSEVVSEAFVGTSALLALGLYSHEKMGEGFAWNQVETSTGRVENRENLAPASAYLIAGRITQMWANGETPSPEMYTDLGKQLIVGEFAGLEQTEGVKAVLKTLQYFGSLEGPEADTVAREMGDSWATLFGSIGSGFTRPLDAPNDLLGIGEVGGASPADMDRRASSSPAERGFLELTRYVDNFLEPFIGEYEDDRGNKSLGPTRKSIAHPEGDVRDPNPMGTLAGAKTSPTMHFTNLILGSTNLPEWKQGQRTAIPQFDRFVNEKLAPIVEGKSEALWNNKNFRALPPNMQASQWKAMVINEKSKLMDKIEEGLYERNPVQPRLLAARAAWAKVPKALKQDALRHNDLSGKNDYEFTMVDLIRLNDYIERRRKNVLDPQVGN
jgi:hypothetical protein